MAQITINGSRTLVAAREGISSRQDKLASVAKKQATGIGLDPRENPAGTATLSTFTTNRLSLRQNQENAQLGMTILDIALTGLQSQQSSLQNALEIAQQAASGLKTDDEMTILSEAFSQLVEGIEETALNTTFLETRLLAQNNATAGTVLDQDAIANFGINSTADAFAADIFDLDKAKGLLVGSVSCVTVTNSFGDADNHGLNISIEVEYKGQRTAFEAHGARITNNAEITLVNNRFAGTTLTLVANEDTDGITANDASNVQDALRGRLNLDNSAEVNPSFTPALDNSVANGEIFTITAQDVAAGDHFIVQDPNDIRKFTLVTPDGVGHNFSLDRSGAQIVTVEGIKIETSDAWDVDDLTADAMKITDTHVWGSTYTTEGGYTASVPLGQSNVEISIPDQRNAAIGVGGLSVDTVANAETAETAIQNAITLLSRTIGNLGSIQGRLATSSDNLSSQQQTLSDTISALENFDMLGGSEDMLNLQVGQSFAAQIYASSVQAHKQLMQIFGGSV